MARINEKSGNCLGCLRGEDFVFFDEKTNSFTHIDLFATPEAASVIICTNPLQYTDPTKWKLGENNVYRPVGETKDEFEFRSMWWDTMIALLWTIYPEDTEEQVVLRNSIMAPNGETGTAQELESRLLAKADEVGIDTSNNDDWGFLLKHN